MDGIPISSGARIGFLFRHLLAYGSGGDSMDYKEFRELSLDLGTSYGDSVMTVLFLIEARLIPMMEENVAISATVAFNLSWLLVAVISREEECWTH